jgi:hypothetical protein
VELYGKKGKLDGVEWAELPAGKSLIRSGAGGVGEVRDPEPQNKDSN